MTPDKENGMTQTVMLPEPTLVGPELLERVLVTGDLSKLTSAERLVYYRAVCESVHLNPLTRPFDYITLSGKLTLYARKDCTDQLREIHGVSITKLEREAFEGIYCVTAYAVNAKGRMDSAIGAVSLEGLRGEAKANAMMKAETKAKRRVTLSLCGLGMLDETEVETISGALTGEPRSTVVETRNTVVTPDSILSGLVSAEEGATPSADPLRAAGPPAAGPQPAGPSDTELALTRSMIVAKRDKLKIGNGAWTRMLRQHTGVDDLGQASLDGLTQLLDALGGRAK